MRWLYLPVCEAEKWWVPKKHENSQTTWATFDSETSYKPKGDNVRKMCDVPCMVVSLTSHITSKVSQCSSAEDHRN